MRSAIVSSNPILASHDAKHVNETDWTAPEGFPPPVSANARKQARLLDAKLRGTDHAKDLLGKSTCTHFPFVQQFSSKGSITAGEFSGIGDNSNLTGSPSKKNFDVDLTSRCPTAGAFPNGTSTFGTSTSTQAASGPPIEGAVPIGTLTIGASTSTQAASGLPIAGAVPIGTITIGVSNGTQAASGLPIAGAVPIGTLTSGVSTDNSTDFGVPYTSNSSGDNVPEANVWPKDLMKLVKQVIELPIRKPDKPEFVFELTTEAAERNFLLLMKRYGGRLDLALKAQQDSPLGMGSEFRPIDVLQVIYAQHPIWK